MCHEGKIVIFGWPRTGSSSLTRALKTNGYRCAGEPFNAPNRYPWRQKYAIENNGGDVRNSLRGLWSNGYVAIKHLHSQLPREQNERMLATPGLKIVYLTRENVLENQLSLYIAMKTRKWNGTEPYTEPVNVAELAGMIEETKELYGHYRTLLKKAAANFIDLSYEELFYRGRLGELIEFLDLDLDDRSYLERSGKLKPPDFYLTIPNIHEMREQLESEENGYLQAGNQGASR